MILCCNALAQRFSALALLTFLGQTILYGGTLLCTMRCSALSLTSTHWMPVAPHISVVTAKNAPDITKCLGGKLTPLVTDKGL